jgi:ParB family transcriptional regulator, chromosome partitioning protein
MKIQIYPEHERIHRAKCDKKHFPAVQSKKKTFEVRRNDRDYRVNDLMIIQEFENHDYTGREAVRRIVYICKNFEGLAHGYVVLGLTDTNE